MTSTESIFSNFDSLTNSSIANSCSSTDAYPKDIFPTETSFYTETFPTDTLPTETFPMDFYSTDTFPMDLSSTTGAVIVVCLISLFTIISYFSFDLLAIEGALILILSPTAISDLEGLYSYLAEIVGASTDLLGIDPNLAEKAGLSCWGTLASPSILGAATSSFGTETSNFLSDNLSDNFTSLELSFALPISCLPPKDISGIVTDLSTDSALADGALTDGTLGSFISVFVFDLLDWTSWTVLRSNLVPESS